MGSGAGIGGAVEVDGKGGKSDPKSDSIDRSGGGNDQTREGEEKKEGLMKEQPDVKITGPAEVKNAARRTLYVGNVGDARAVLSYVGVFSFFFETPSSFSLSPLFDDRMR